MTTSNKAVALTLETIVKGEIVKAPFVVTALPLDTYYATATAGATLSNALTELLLGGNNLPFESSKQFVNLLNSNRNKAIKPARYLRSEVNATCQAIDLAIKIRKNKSGELLSAWNALIETKQKENDANVKANVLLKKNGATEKKITRSMQPSLKGLADLVIPKVKSSTDELITKYIKSAYALMLDTSDNDLDKMVALMTSMGIDIPKAE